MLRELGHWAWVARLGFRVMPSSTRQYISFISYPFHISEPLAGTFRQALRYLRAGTFRRGAVQRTSRLFRLDARVAPDRRCAGHE